MSIPALASKSSALAHSLSCDVDSISLVPSGCHGRWTIDSHTKQRLASCLSLRGAYSCASALLKNTTSSDRPPAAPLNAAPVSRVRASPLACRYLAKPGAWPYCSAQPSGVLLDAFGGADFLLPPGGVAAL